MMKLLFEYIARIEKIHELIKNKKTGTPNEFARSLHRTTSRLYTIIEELKSQGAPILYSRTLQTYYYSKRFEIDITCSFRELSDNEKTINNGGSFISFNRSFFNNDFYN